MSNSFIDYINQIVPLTQESVADAEQCMDKLSFPKRHVLLRQGQVCRHLYFADKGLVRMYYNKDGNDITDYFAFENNFIGGIDSFFSQKPSSKCIETIEPTTIYAIGFNDLELLYRKHHCIERLDRLLTTQAFLFMQDRLYAIQFHTARKRYEQLISMNPDVLKGFHWDILHPILALHKQH